jgi:hypothetical protein
MSRQRHAHRRHRSTVSDTLGTAPLPRTVDPETVEALLTHHPLAEMLVESAKDVADAHQRSLAEVTSESDRAWAFDLWSARGRRRAQRQAARRESGEEYE